MKKRDPLESKNGLKNELMWAKDAREPSKKDKKKEQFVRPMMTLVPFFSRLVTVCISLQFGARELKEKRDERRDAQRSTPKSASFREKPAFLRRRARAGGRAGGRVDAKRLERDVAIYIEREAHPLTWRKTTF